MLRSSNPTQRPDVFGAAQTWEDLEARGVSTPPKEKFKAEPGKMSLQGTINKTLILLGLCAATAVATWEMVTPTGNAPVQVGYGLPLFGGLIAGLVFALITVFKPKAAPVTAPLYAIAEGAFLGAISGMYAERFGSIENGAVSLNSDMVLQAIMLTFGVLGAMLVAYTTRLIKPTESIFGATMPFLHDSGPIGIGISLVIVAIAALNLVLDFDYIEQGVNVGAPKYCEWYGGFTLLVTLVWLYLEILRLLSKFQSRD
jgi:uncharacterized YccA/Bax inhibitor family protein